MSVLSIVQCLFCPLFGTCQASASAQLPVSSAATAHQLLCYYSPKYSATCLCRMFPNDAFYKKRMLTFIDDWLTGRGPPNYVTYTPKGLAFSGDWGSLRHVGNALFLMQSFVHTSKDQALNRRINCFTHRQLRYILGSTGRSFVVGFGNNPPQQPHHRAASCTPGQPCSWDALNVSTLVL